VTGPKDFFQARQRSLRIRLRVRGGIHILCVSFVQHSQYKEIERDCAGSEDNFKRESSKEGQLRREDSFKNWMFSRPFVCMCVQVCACPRRFVLNFTQGTCVTSGDLIQNLESVHTKYLCVQLRLILHFEVSVSVTTDFPVNWPQCQSTHTHTLACVLTHVHTHSHTRHQDNHGPYGCVEDISHPHTITTQPHNLTHAHTHLCKT